MMEQLLVLFEDVNVFLHQDETGSLATMSKLTGILSDPSKKVLFVGRATCVASVCGLWQTLCHCNVKS